MNEETANTNAEETTDVFSQGWDDSGTVVGSEVSEPEDAIDEAEESAEEAKPEDSEDAGATAEPGADGKDEGSKDGVDTDVSAGAEQKPTESEVQPKTWTLRHLDETKTVNEQEITALAQKGLDYDRIREKYDAAKPVMELFTQSAKQAHMTVDEYVSYIRTEAKKASGMDEAEAKRAVEFEDREAALSAKETAEKERQSAEQKAEAERKAAEESRKESFAKFAKKYPDVKPEDIPKSVWAAVANGDTIIEAYQDYKLHEVTIKATAEKKNKENAARSTGSMKSAGNENKSKDPFAEGWAD